MIRIGESDTIIDIVNKINKEESNEIILEFPFGHPVIHNYISLKILKSKTSGKRLTIVTTDILSRKIGKNLGINYSIIKDSEFFEEKKSEANLLKHNYSFKEYLLFEIRKNWRKFINYIFGLKQVNKLKYYSPYSKIKKGSLILLASGLLTSIAMFIFIFYFAVTKSFIIITPEINIKAKAKNITFKEVLSDEEKILDNENIIEVKKLSAEAELEYVASSTKIDYENTSRAVGKAIIYNELYENQTLLKNTRLLSSDGILFETKDKLFIPKATKSESGTVIPGQVEIDIIAKVYDDKGAFIGTRGNIAENENLILPGLKNNRDKIYAVTTTPTTGGSDNYSYIIGENDFENAGKILEEKLKNEAIEKIRHKLDEDNKLNNVTYSILGIDDIIKYSDLEIINVGGLEVGDKTDNFKLKGKIKVETYIYNKSSVVNSLKELVNSSLLHGTEKLISIDEKSIRFSNIISRIDEPYLEVKATTEIESAIAYDFGNDYSNYVKKLKSTIAGIPKDEAISILLNETKISNVEIENSPFFLKNISSRTDNIILKVDE